ncbi:acyl-CoA thioesterase [Pararhodobacter oceanensis]|uniref:acyl-CoA thioesterase n=1 Tax=Pararhodobacter oceanensis TaxID=2172121 RepID=UPI003A9445F6
MPEMRRSPTAALPFHTQEGLRYRDVDPMGHVNNSVYATLFEQNRVAFQSEPGGFCEAEGQIAVLATQTIDFLREMHFPGTVDIGLGISRIGRSSFDFIQEITLEGRLIARGRCTQVLIDEGARTSVPLSELQIEMLTRWLVTP